MAAYEETNATVQQQLELTSEVVMNMWSKINALEVELSKTMAGQVHCGTFSPNRSGMANDAPPLIDAQVGQQLCQMPPLPTTPPRKKPRTRKNKLDSRAAIRKDTAPPAELVAVLADAAQVLDATAGIMDAKVTSTTAGTLATLTIRVLENSADEMRSVAAIAKSVILEAAARSENVYVLGYEATPFMESPSEDGFSGTLAVASNIFPTSFFCWETYTKASCPNGCSCKLRHPGRHEIQPMRVVIEQIRPFDGRS